MSDTLLQVNDLKTYFHTSGGDVKAVDGVSFSIDRGEIVGVVGESGCGKSVTSLSIMQLLPEPYSRIAGGEILFEGENLLKKSESEMCDIRGNRISMIFQEPMTSLNPVFPCGDQIAEALRRHKGMSRQQADQKAVELLGMVGIPEPQKRAKEYPHQLSGGMRQRVMIALALCCGPKLLIADEPTTALDVTIQAQILDLMRKLQKELGMSVLLITHDLGVVAEMASRVIVMYSGKIVEEANGIDLFSTPLHPYTEGLLRSIPRLNEDVERLNVIEGVVPNPLDRPAGCSFSPRCPYATERCKNEQPPMREIAPGHRVACFEAEKMFEERQHAKLPLRDHSHDGDPKPPLLEMKNLKKYYPIKKGLLVRNAGYVKAVDDVSLTIYKGEVLGLVGESGCGKTTLGKAILRLIPATSGEILFEGQDILTLPSSKMQKLRREIQVVFQDPYASLNPRMTVEQIITEPMIIHNLVPKEKLHDRATELLEAVGLTSYHLKRYPHEFSGGQRQRIGIARALALNPKLIICDEPVSALDVSIQSQILNLLKDLQKQFDLSYLFIAHGLSAVKHVSDRVGVMYLGKIVELAPSLEIYEHPLHPYTRALISAVPIADPQANKKERILLEGDVPSPINPPSGCRFHTRCAYATERCRTEEPPLRDIGHAHYVACHLV